ncbi:MAG: PIG-L family deacetylase [Fibrobacteres bacterium]|nr:PIG-L family deacetylase [Fibrobacterota bacterium]
MLTARLPGLKTVLALGAHCDDIEIGCGGALLRLLKENPGLEVYWIVFASNPVRKSEAEKSAGLFLAGAAKAEVRVHAFRDGFLPYHGIEVKEAFEVLKAQVNPDLILTHYRQDLHQDHRLISELTWNTWRNHLIWEYEIPKYDGDLGVPNVFVELPESVFRRKVELIREGYPTQWGKNWFSEDTFLGLMRIRGMECQAESSYAEAFYGRKLKF